MAFRANSLQGSLIVLGTKEASEIPEIPGRGIWNFGTKKLAIQSPYVEENTIQERCLEIAEMFKTGKRSIYGTMLGVATKENANKSQKSAYETLEVL
jgi:hypothetical protein